jgi:toxin FitB
MWLLDTNVVSELMKPLPNPAVLAWLDGQPATTLFSSVITLAEIELGIALLPDGKRKEKLAAAASAVFEEDFAGAVLAFDPAAAHRYAEVVSGRIRCGRHITSQNAEIAAIALASDLVLVTRNEKDFSGIPGLSILNPWQAG